MNYEGIYAIYRKKSKFGAQIAFLIDQMPFQGRRSAVMNNYDVICKRRLARDEIKECEANKGVNIKRYIVWYYKDVDYLIFEDKKYNVDTPLEMISRCNKLGYKRKQLELEL